MFELEIPELLGPPAQAARATDHHRPLAGEASGCLPQRGRWRRRSDSSNDEREGELYADVDEIERKIHSAMDGPEASLTSLEALEAAVELKAQEAVDAPPRAMIAGLSTDLSHAYRMLCDSSAGQSGRRRLLRTSAFLSALLAEEFMMVGHASRSRRWFLMADELSLAADDQATRSTVGCLASRLPLYFGEIAEAVEMARGVCDIAPPRHLSTALAPMVEALALAQLGDMPGSKDALRVAQRAFERLGDNSVQDTVFGFSARRFTFYESRALLDTGQFSAAWSSQEDALRLYPAAMIGDVAMIHLDRARLLVKQGHIDTGCTQATDVLLRMPEEQRAEIFRSRALRLLAAVPRKARTLSAVADLREALTYLSGDPEPSAR